MRYSIAKKALIVLSLFLVWSSVAVFSQEPPKMTYNITKPFCASSTSLTVVSTEGGQAKFNSEWGIGDEHIKLYGFSARKLDGCYLHLINAAGEKVEDISHLLYIKKDDLGRLARLEVSSNAADIFPYAGKTLLLELRFNGANSLAKNGDIYFEVITAGNVVNASPDFTFSNYYSSYVKTACYGDVNVVKIGNKETPFGTSTTYLGNNYKIDYLWQVDQLNAAILGSPDHSGTSFTLDASYTTGAESETWLMSIRPKFTINGAETDVCSDAISPQFALFYFAPIKVEFNLGGNITPSSSTSVPEVAVCEGEALDCNFTFYSQSYGADWPYGDVKTSISYVDPHDGLTKQLVTDEVSHFATTIAPTVLRAVAGSDTEYVFDMEILDLYSKSDDKEDPKCVTHKQFKVIVKEKSAVINITGPDEVCEGGDVALSATVEGNSAYNYEWKCLTGALSSPDAGTIDCTGGNIANLSITDNAVVYGTGIRNYELTLDNGGCKVSANKLVTVNKKPVLTPGGDKTICAGESVEISVSCNQNPTAGITYTWKENGTVIAGEKGSKVTVSPTATSVYEVTAKNNETGCNEVAPALITVNVNELPVIQSVTASPNVLCVGSSSTVTATLDPSYTVRGDLEYVWTWQEAGVAKTKTTLNVNNITIVPVDASTSVSVTVTDVECTSAVAATVDITVNSLPEFAPDADNTTCDGESATINMNPAGAGYSYIVTPQSGAPAGAVSGDVYTVNYPASGLTAPVTYTYNVTATNGAGCEATSSFAVTLNPLPSVTASADKSAYCVGDKITVTAQCADSNVEIVWSGAATANGKVCTYTAKPSDAGTLTFNYTATNKVTGCSTSGSVTVSVNALPSVAITPSASEVCQGGTVTLQATNDPSFTYAWSTGETSQSITVTPSLPSTTYSVIVTDGNGCSSAEAETTISVNKLPVISLAISPSEVCVGSTEDVILSPSVTNGVIVANYVWNGVTPTDNGDGTYTVSGITWNADRTFEVYAESDKVCASLPTTAQLNVRPIPNAPILDASTPTVCEGLGTEVTLSVVSPSSSYEYEWFDAANTSLGKGTTRKVTPVTTTTYYAVARDLTYTTRCESAQASITITVVSAEDAPVASVTPDTFCDNDAISATLSVASPAAGVTYKWYNSSNVYIGEGATFAVSPSASESYYAIAVNGVGCESGKSNVVNVTINKSKKLVADGPTTYEICENLDATLKVVAPEAGLTYFWTGEAPTVDKTSLTVFPTANSTYQVYAVDGNGCHTNTIDFDVVVKKLPVATLIPANPAVCEGETIDLTVTTNVASGLNITWFHNGVDVSSTNTVSIKPVNGDTYSFSIWDNNTNCYMEQPFDIQVYSLPNFTIDGITTICEGTSLSLSANVVAAPGDVYTYTWSKGGVTISSSDVLDIASVSNSDAGEYMLTVTNAAGCSVTQSVDVVVNPRPQPIITGAATICEGGSVSLECQDIFNTYEWSVAGAVVSNTHELLYDASAIPAGTDISVSLVVSDANGCLSEVASYSVAVAPIPVINNVVGTLKNCDGGNVTATVDIVDPSMYNYVWYDINGNEILGQNGSSYSISNITSDINGQYSVKAIHKITGCESQVFNFELGVYDAKVALTSSQTQICNNSTTPVTFTATYSSSDGLVATNYEFTLTSVGGTVLATQSSAADSYVLDPTTLAEGDYKLKVVADGTCVLADEITVKIVSAPDNTITHNLPACQGTNVVVEAAVGAISYEFFVDGISRGESADNVFVENGLASGTDIYVVIRTGDCMSVSDHVTVKYLDAFEPVASINGGDDMICEDEIVTYDIASSTLNIHSFIPVVDGTELPEVVLSTDATSASFDYNSIADYSIYFKVRSTEGCEWTTNAITPQISHLVINSVDVTNNSTVCLLAPFNVTVDASGSLNGNLTYEFIVDGVAVQNSASNTCQYVPGTIGNVQVTVNVTDVDAGCTVSELVTVNVIDLPSANLLVPGLIPVDINKYQLCYDEKINFEIACDSAVVLFDGVEMFAASQTGSAWDVKTIVADPSVVPASLIFDATSSALTFSVGYMPLEHNVQVKVIDRTTKCESLSETVSFYFKEEIIISVNAPHVIDNNQVTICQGDVVEFSASSSDATYITMELGGAIVATNTSFSYTGTTIGEETLIIRSEFGCSKVITVKTVEAPSPKVAFSSFDGNSWVEQNVTDGVSIDAYEFCSGTEFILDITGAASYSLSIQKDGVDITPAELPEILFDFDGAVFSQTSNLTFDEVSAAGKDYNEYKFTCTASVGSCVETLSFTLNIYKLPSATLDITPGRLVIEGTNVVLTATPGYSDYKFFINGVVANADFTSNEHAISNISENANVQLIITNAYGCTIELIDSVVILDEVVPRHLRTSADYYCSESNGVDISIEAPQIGVTYHLEGCATCGDITYNGVDSVVWSGVKVAAGVNPQTFNASAFHASLPSVVVPMINTVTITEVKTPDVYRLTPYNKIQTSCNSNDELELEGSEVGVNYVLYLNGVQIYGPVAGTGMPIKLIKPDAIGSYTVVAYSSYGIESVCSVTMDGEYKIDLPEAIPFDMLSLPQSGNYCADADGVEIKLNGSEAGKDYYLLLNNDYVINTDTVKVAGTGSEISFGKFTVDGTYTVACIFNGCKSLMNGSVNVTKYDNPISYAVSVSDNMHFCEGTDGVIISVSGQQLGYEYMLYRDGNLVETIVGTDTDVPFDFTKVNIAGSYSVIASIPFVENGCTSVLASDLEIVEDKLPTPIVLTIGDLYATADTICETEASVITISNAQIDVTYKLLYNGIEVSQVIANTNTVVFDNIVDAGIYTIRAIKDYAYQSCPIDFSNAVSLVVVPRPSAGGQVEAFYEEEPAEKLAIDNCYGKDIVVENAQVGFKYFLYKVDGSSNIITPAIQSFVAVGNSVSDRFVDIRDNDGTYRIYVSNTHCEDQLMPDVSVVNTKYVDVQRVIAESYEMCQGDLGREISLEASETGVTYTLYFSDNNAVEQLEQIVATDVTGIKFSTLMYRQGTYYVEGAKTSADCATRMMPDIDFRVNMLPVSYELKGDLYYCGASAGVEISLRGSELGVEYTLYSETADGRLTRLEPSIIGSGDEFTFPGLYPEGVYVASARNYSTGCTSSMKGRLVVKHQDETVSQSFNDTTIYVCGNDKPLFTVDSKYLKSGLSYSLVKGDVYNVDSLLSTSVYNGLKFDISVSEYRDYSLWAHYEDFSCLSLVGVVSFEQRSIDVFNLSQTIDCVIEQPELVLDGSQVGVTYDLYSVDASGVETFVAGSTQIGNGNSLSWIVGNDASVVSYFAVATFNDCTEKMNGYVAPLYRSEIKDIAVGDINELVCSGDTYHFVSSELIDGVTYYIMRNGDVPSASTVPVYSMKADATNNSIVADLPSGNYTVWASHDNYDCLVQMYGSIVLSQVNYTRFQISSNEDVNCVANELEIYLSGSDVDVSYTLNGDTATAQVGTGAPLMWHVEGSGIVRFDVVASNKGKCPESIGFIDVNFDRIAEPNARMDMYIEGEIYSLPDTAEVCANSFITFTTEVDNVGVSKFIYYVDGIKVRESANNLFIPSFDGKSGKVAITVDVITTSNCEFAGVDTIVVKIKESQLDGNRLVALDNNPEYCEGEKGVKLCFLNAIKGEVYRLYKKVDNGFPELVDIQEIPFYSTINSVDSLMFNGWSDGTDQFKAYASAGVYYVTIQASDGCEYVTNELEVIMNPLPVWDDNKLYYAIVTEDVEGNMVIDQSTISETFGLLDAGRLVLEKARAGVTYYLYHIDKDAYLDTVSCMVDGATLFFGPIINTELDSSVSDPSESKWGEGAYTIVATNDTTLCSTEIGMVEFVEEELIAYDVYLFMNKDQTSVRQSLIPKYGSKGNHKYIDWSSKVDVVYTPDVQIADDGKFEITSDENEDKYEDKSGYTSIWNKSNIVFEILPPMKDVAVSDTTLLSQSEQGCDSVQIDTAYRYFMIDTLGMPIVDTVGHYIYTERPDTCSCDSVAYGIYSYFRVGEKIVKQPATKLGNYGFDDYGRSGLDTLHISSRTGMFVYSKRPSFFGKEEVEYRIYNLRLKNVRTSNTAKITVLCGNQTGPDTTTVFLIPNAFSPNGDGYNDVFRILLPHQYEEHSESSLEVYNRWGTLVYRSSGNQYGKDCEWWDGTSKTSNMLTVGNNLPSGTYFYVYTITFIDAAQASKSTHKLSGYIELRR